MDKLVITVTCDSTMAYPSNPHNPTPKGFDEVAQEYIRSVNAGASICHLHGPYTIDAETQATTDFCNPKKNVYTRFNKKKGCVK